MQISVGSSQLVGFELEIYPSKEVQSPGAIVIALFVAIFIVFTCLFRHLQYWNGLRMFQISATINLKTKFEGPSNRPCAKHNEDQRESRRVCEWQRKLLKFPRNPPHKKNVNLQHYFFLRQFGSFRCNRFVLLFFSANGTVLMVRMKDDGFRQVVPENVTTIWPVLFWSLDDLFRWKHTTTSYFKECLSN